MSGGVDSSVAAALLVEQGYDVTGIMLKLWRGEAANLDSGCCNVGAASDARRVADVLGIPFYVLNFAERFEETVIANFHADYASGRTPNPCVRCNQWIKFDALLERAQALGADVLATGHYARVRSDAAATACSAGSITTRTRATCCGCSIRPSSRARSFRSATWPSPRHGGLPASSGCGRRTSPTRRRSASSETVTCPPTSTSTFPPPTNRGRW